MIYGVNFFSYLCVVIYGIINTSLFIYDFFYNVYNKKKESLIKNFPCPNI